MTQLPSGTGVPVCYRHPGREAHIRCQRCGRPICPDCMVSASVGFQCPECVAEGRRTVRQPKRLTGARSGFRALPVTYTLLALNVVVFALINLTGRYSSRLLELFALRSRGACVIDEQRFFPQIGSRAVCEQVQASQGVATHWVAGASDGAPWQLLTTMFTHVEILHIAVNMFSLYVLGQQLEPLLGRVRFLALYLLSGLAGSALIYWAAGPTDFTVGASTALFGLMGAFAVFLLRARTSLQPLLWTLVINFAITFAVPGLSWQGHVGGFIGGLAVGTVYTYARGVRRERLQLGGVVGVGAVIVLAMIVRTLTLT